MPVPLVALALFAGATLTATVTVQSDRDVRPLAGALVHALDGPAQRGRGTLELTCTATTVWPTVTPILSGQTIRVTNARDAVATVTMDASSGARLLSATLMARGQRTPRVRPGAGRVVVRCDAARADVLVLDHDRVATTDRAGRFVLSAPAGPVRVWHPAYGRVEQIVTSSTGVLWPTF